MKIKSEIELTSIALRRWQKYKLMHAFLNPSDNALMSALVRAGLESFYAHVRQKIDRRGIQKGRHDQ